MAEVKGESELYNDLLIRLIIDSADAKADYKKCTSLVEKTIECICRWDQLLSL